MTRSARIGLALLGLLALSAWTPIDGSRPVWRMTVPYTMNSAGSADLGASATEAEVMRGMGDWTLVSCTSLEASYQGMAAVRPTGGDGRSVIGWTESGWPHDSSAIGVTGPAWTTGGVGPTIREADMEMNGVNFTWTTASGTGSRVNTYSIVLHEGGHYYGLGHSNDSNATMYFAYSGGIDSLVTDDQNGICALYPGAGSDCTTTGCPSGQVCNAGVCETVTGDGGTCSPCTGPGDCDNGICLGYPDGGGYCGHNCTSAADCGAGEMCYAISGLATRQCIRFSGAQPSCAAAPTGCTSDAGCPATQMCNLSNGMCVPRTSTGTTPLGGACTDSGECVSGLCFAGACSQACNWLDVMSCPTGFYCNGQATGSCGSGLCQAGVTGAGALGAACAANTDCATLYCASGICSEPCIPGGAVVCDDGYACQVGATAGCGSCLPERGALGDPCAMNEDCASGICATTTTSFCTALCDPAGATCPARYTCTAAGPVSVCVPDGGTLGSGCASDADCISGICAREGDASYCTRICAADPCPVGFSCIDTADGTTRVCRPRSVPGAGCGCNAAGAGGEGPVGLFLLGLALTIAIRSRR